jgi:biopolymer transport protein ExbD
MARIHRMRPPTDIPDASMADVAFLLLIFFLATTIISDEYGLSLMLPQRVSATPQVVERRDVMVISTDASGEGFFVDDLPVDLDEIPWMVEDRQAGNDRLIVSVEPHPQAPYRAMIDILDELKGAGARRISLRTRAMSGG